MTDAEVIAEIRKVLEILDVPGCNNVHEGLTVLAVIRALIFSHTAAVA